MKTLCAAALLAVACVIGAPHAAADPRDWVPYCSGDQTPMDDNCQTMPHQHVTHGSPGANPNVGVGLDPGNEPVV